MYLPIHTVDLPDSTRVVGFTLLTRLPCIFHPSRVKSRNSVTHQDEETKSQKYRKTQRTRAAQQDKRATMADDEVNGDGDGDQQQDANATPNGVSGAANKRAAGSNNALTTPPPSAARTPLIRHLCLFAVVYFINIVVFFFTRDIPTGIVRLQDVLTMLNPLMQLPLFYVIALIHLDDDDHQKDLRNNGTTMGWRSHVIFLLITVVYVHGDGYHLAANAINRYEDDLEASLHPAVQNVVYFYDEELGHYYTYIGLMGLHIFWMVRQMQLPFVEPFAGRGGQVALMASGILHGLVLFIAFIEGHFGIPALVFFVLMVVWCGVRRDRLAHDPIVVFTLCYAATGMLLLVVWAVWQAGFPELTAAGII
jgi:hypothetical protein